MEAIQVGLRLVKSTKSTHVYDAIVVQGKPPAVRTLYIEKWALTEPPPAAITIVIALA
jgi:hypothetical protein